MQKPRDFARRKILTPTLQDMVLGKDKKFSISEVVVRMWGEHRVEANVQRLYKLLDPNQPDKCLKVDDLAGLTYATQDMAAVYYLCELFDHAAFKLPDLQDQPMALNRETAGVMMETGDLIKEVGQAIDPLGPGGASVTRHEREAVRSKLKLAIRRLVALEAALDCQKRQGLKFYE